MLHTGDSTVGDKLIAASPNGQNISGYLLNQGSFV
jgi:hypothetical protein